MKEHKALLALVVAHELVSRSDFVFVPIRFIHWHEEFSCIHVNINNRQHLAKLTADMADSIGTW